MLIGFLFYVSVCQASQKCLHFEHNMLRNTVQVCYEILSFIWIRELIDQRGWGCEVSRRSGIEFIAAMLEKQGCSFQTKYLFTMLCKIYVRFIESPVIQWLFNAELFIMQVSEWSFLQYLPECSPSWSQYAVDQVPTI